MFRFPWNARDNWLIMTLTLFIVARLDWRQHLPFETAGLRVLSAI